MLCFGVRRFNCTFCVVLLVMKRLVLVCSDMYQHSEANEYSR